MPVPLPLLMPVLFPPPGFQTMSLPMSQLTVNFRVIPVPATMPEFPPEPALMFALTFAPVPNQNPVHWWIGLMLKPTGPGPPQSYSERQSRSGGEVGVLSWIQS